MAPIAGAAVVTSATSLFVSPGPSGWWGAGLSVVMLAIAAEDWRRFRIPDPLTFLAGALAVLMMIAEPASGDLAAAAIDAAFRALAMTLLFLAIRSGFRLARGEEGMGLGDVKLAAVAGLWLDWDYLPSAIEISAVAGLVLALATRWRTGEPINRGAPLPFGALLAPAIWLCWLAKTAAPLPLG